MSERVHIFRHDGRRRRWAWDVWQKAKERGGPKTPRELTALGVVNDTILDAVRHDIGVDEQIWGVSDGARTQRG